MIRLKDILNEDTKETGYKPAKEVTEPGKKVTKKVKKAG